MQLSHNGIKSIYNTQFKQNLWNGTWEYKNSNLTSKWPLIHFV